jgi:DNA-binding NarL/FixJ family response regulator
MVDNDVWFRQYITRLLSSEPDMEIVDEAENGQEAILKARAVKPDLVLMDIRMPGINGLEATRRLKNEMPDLKVIISSLYEMDEYLEAAKEAGAKGYILKKTVGEQLVITIRKMGAEADNEGLINDRF